ncbi:MAG: gliding motility-associated C-terminal domain-containing protein [Crocinitomicaceae bacterium]|nr:gliding motility-associated C-terminal domain-containing protein [Crocinitomicaceae bacterium]
MIKHLKLKKVLFISALMASVSVAAQTVDLAINPNVLSPDLNSCDLDQESLTVILVNTSAFPYSGTLEMGYKINAGSPVTYNETINLTPGPTYTYTFPNPIDFSGCQVYDMSVWVHEVNDIDNNNDTINFQITSDCSSATATISTSDNCYSSGDTLYLNNYYGNITTWEESGDNGVNWTTTATSNNWFLPSNGTPNLVRVTIDSPYGICGPDIILFNAPYDNFLIGVNAGNDTTVFINDSLHLNGSGGTNFTWYPGYNMTDSTISDPWVWPGSTTLYYLESSDGGCTGLDSILITVIDNSGTSEHPDNKLLIPNPISPSQSYLKIIGIENYPNNQLFIFNLNGQLVYSASPYLNQLNTSSLAPGNYVYILDLNKENQFFRGKITVVR